MGTPQNHPGEGVLTSTQNLYFEQKYGKKNYLKTFSFLVVKCSIYLNRPVFVMNLQNIHENRFKKSNDNTIINTFINVTKTNKY